MIKKLLGILSFILLMLCCFSCNQRRKINTFDAYVKWLNDTENGLSKTKKVGLLVMNVKFMPAELLAYNELKRNKEICAEDRDSLVAVYKQQMTFLLTLSVDDPNTPVKGDLFLSDLNEQSEYGARVHDLNFNMDYYIHMLADEKEIQPVLINLENDYNLYGRKTFNVVFTDTKTKGLLAQANKFDFVFDDEFFKTGRSHFVFSHKDLNNVPEFVY